MKPRRKLAKKPADLATEQPRWRSFKTLREVAEHYGVPHGTIEKMRARREFEPTADNRWDTRRLDPVLANWKPRGKKASKAASEKERAQIRKINEETRLVKLRIMAARGEVVGRDEVEEAHQLFANVFRERMLSVPGRCRLKVANQPADVAEAIIDAEIRQALNEMPEELARAVPDKPPAALLAMAEQDEDEAE